MASPTYTAAAFPSLPASWDTAPADALGSRSAPIPRARGVSVKSLDDSDRFTAYCHGAVSKIRLTYLRLLARDKLATGHEVVRRRDAKVTSVHQPGKPAQFSKRRTTRTVSFSK